MSDDGGLYFGPCLNPDGADPVKSLMSGFAHSRQHVNGDAAWFAEQVRGTAPEPPPDGFLVPPGFAEDLLGEIRKLYGYIEVPDELLPGIRKPLPPLPWRWRLRNRITSWRERAARRAYKTIAGDWPDDGEDDGWAID